MDREIHQRKMRILLLGAAVMLSVMTAGIRAEARGGEASAPDMGYSYILYDNSSGLPTSEANAVAQTENGFIWIGGYSGLIRYDGNDFYRYDSSVGISSVMSLYVDSRDRLWIGTNDNGAALYENGEFRFYGKEEGLASLSVRSVTEDASGNIILATTRGLAYVDADCELHGLDAAQLNTKYICEVKSDADGTVYGSTLDGSFFTLEDLAVTHFYSGPNLGMGVVISICPDPHRKGQVYLGTEGSEVIRGDILSGMEDYETLSVFPQTSINSVYPAEDGRLWICADNGIGYLDEQEHYVELDQVPMDNSIDRMTVDQEGNLWFVSSRQGVMKAVKSLFTDVSDAAGLEPAVVNTTCLYHGDLYIGTDNGLQLLDKSYQRKEDILTELLEGIRIRCIKEDSSGKLWLCTYSDYGLVCYDGDGSYTLYNETAGLKSNRVRVIEELSDGTIMVATSGGVNLIKDGRIADAYDEKDGIINTEILSICEGEDGKVYLGSDGDGVYILQNGKVSRLGVDDGLKSEIILRIRKDVRRSVYWIITSNSISCMKDEKINTLSNFPYSNNFDMYFDDRGGIWILSSNGIYMVNGDRLLADEEMEYSFYDRQSGLPSVTTANSRSALAADGTLYLAGVQGVSSININLAQSADNTVKLVVPFIEIDNRVIHLKDDETVVIPADCRRLTIYGYALTYTLQNPRLSFCLEGFDEKPVSVSRQDIQPVSYTNLDSGEYVFHLSVIDTMTGEAENTIAVRLVKEKAFYERADFWICSVSAAVLLFLLAIRLYMRAKMAKLLKKQKENKIFIDQVIQAFAKTIDLADKYTNGHSFRVAKYARMLAERMGYSETQLEQVYNIGLLHDIGKITIPDEILNKPGRLTAEEFAIMKQHSINGYDILKGIESAPDLALGAGYHHERIDGTGYPFGKTEEEIPQVAKIIAVADAFDAMNSTRPYRKQMKMEDIVAELKKVAGTQLNGEIVGLLLTLIEKGELD